MPLDPQFPSSSLPWSPALGSGDATRGLSRAGVREEATPASGCGARPLLRTAAALLGRRRAEKPFEMRGAADHWSLGWGWERAAALEGPRIRKGSSLRSNLPSALELAGYTDVQGLIVERNGGFRFFLSPEEK